MQSPVNLKNCIFILSSASYFTGMNKKSKVKETAFVTYLQKARIKVKISTVHGAQLISQKTLAKRFSYGSCCNNTFFRLIMYYFKLFINVVK